MSGFKSPALAGVTSIKPKEPRRIRPKPPFITLARGCD
jgi:hypothetical protein